MSAQVITISQAGINKYNILSKMLSPYNMYIVIIYDFPLYAKINEIFWHYNVGVITINNSYLYITGEVCAFKLLVMASYMAFVYT